MSDQRKRIADLLCTAGAALLEAGRLMGGSAPTGEAGRVATDAELDAENGDPVIKIELKGKYVGPQFKGKRLSQATPAYLAAYAETKDYFADNPKQGKERYAKDDRREAALARGWVRRLRANATPTPTPTNGASTQPTSEQTPGDGDGGFSATDDDDFKA